jgi:hypothetical protein
MKRTLVAALVAAVLAGTAVGVGRADDIKKCTVAVRGDSPVRDACEEGGIDQARATMKRLLGIARSKQRGKHWSCDDCHADQETWKLTEEARRRFKELLAIVADE